MCNTVFFPEITCACFHSTTPSRLGASMNVPESLGGVAAKLRGKYEQDFTQKMQASLDW